MHQEPRELDQKDIGVLRFPVQPTDCSLSEVIVYNQNHISNNVSQEVPIGSQQEVQGSGEKAGSSRSQPEEDIGVSQYRFAGSLG